MAALLRSRLAHSPRVLGSRGAAFFLLAWPHSLPAPVAAANRQRRLMHGGRVVEVGGQLYNLRPLELDDTPHMERLAASTWGGYDPLVRDHLRHFSSCGSQSISVGAVYLGPKDASFFDPSLDRCKGYVVGTLRADIRDEGRTAWLCNLRVLDVFQNRRLSGRLFSPLQQHLMNIPTLQRLRGAVNRANEPSLRFARNRGMEMREQTATVFWVHQHQVTPLLSALDRFLEQLGLVAPGQPGPLRRGSAMEAMAVKARHSRLPGFDFMWVDYNLYDFNAATVDRLSGQGWEARVSDDIAQAATFDSSPSISSSVPLGLSLRCQSDWYRIPVQLVSVLCPDVPQAALHIRDALQWQIMEAQRTSQFRMLVISLPSHLEQPLAQATGMQWTPAELLVLLERTLPTSTLRFTLGQCLSLATTVVTGRHAWQPFLGDLGQSPQNGQRGSKVP